MEKISSRCFFFEKFRQSFSWAGVEAAGGLPITPTLKNPKNFDLLLSPCFLCFPFLTLLEQPTSLNFYIIAIILPAFSLVKLSYVVFKWNQPKYSQFQSTFYYNTTTLQPNDDGRDNKCRKRRYSCRVCQSSVCKINWSLVG